MKRITTTEVAEMLSVSAESVRVYAKSGFITPMTVGNEFGRGKRMYFDSDEVAAFAKGGAVAAKAYRESHGNAPPIRQKKKRPLNQSK